MRRILLVDMERTRQAEEPARATQTITAAPPQPAPVVQAGRLRLRGQHTDGRRVQWSSNTIDNENCGRKSSKICCIYHKPKSFDESSSDESSSSDSDDTGDEHDRTVKDKMKHRTKRKIAKLNEKHKDCTCTETATTESPEAQSGNPAAPDSGDNNSPRGKGNAFDKGVK